MKIITLNNLYIMYYVERKTEALGWRKIPFAEHHTRAYCDGYVNALDAMYPSDPLRIVKIENDTTKVIRETKGKSKIHLN